MPEIDPRDAQLFFSTLSGVARASGFERVADRIPGSLILKRERPRARLRITRAKFRAFDRGRVSDRQAWIAELWFDSPEAMQAGLAS
ncbi:MAG: hypothetical protein AAB295_00655, partial [Chloroflexota bacterium]